MSHTWMVRYGCVAWLLKRTLSMHVPFVSSNLWIRVCTINDHQLELCICTALYMSKDRYYNLSCWNQPKKTHMIDIAIAFLACGLPRTLGKMNPFWRAQIFNHGPHRPGGQFHFEMGGGGGWNNLPTKQLGYGQRQNYRKKNPTSKRTGSNCSLFFYN